MKAIWCSVVRYHISDQIFVFWARSLKIIHRRVRRERRDHREIATLQQKNIFDLRKVLLSLAILISAILSVLCELCG